MAQKTIYDIAKIVGCSAGTVSRAINNRPGVGKKTKEKIFEVIQAEGYHPNAIAKSLVSQQTNTVALIIPDISEEFLSSVALAADRTLSDQNYNIILYNTYWDADIEAKKIKFALEKQVDGIILKPAGEDLSMVQELPVPCVLISHTTRENVCCIDIENETAGFSMVEHLIARGFQKIAFVGGPQQSSSTMLRLNGYRNALQQHKLQESNDWVWFGAYTFENGYAAAQHMLTLPDRPDAFFCSSDSVALGAYQGAIECKLSVPGDCGIAGFNNDKIASFPQINLTTVNQQPQEMGKTAAEMLIDMIETGNQGLKKKVMLYPEIIARGTT